MKRILAQLALLGLVLGLTLCGHAVTPSYVSYLNWCYQGGLPTLVQGMKSSTLTQTSFPTCSVSVYVHGGGLANLYSDKAGTPLSNPFTATTIGLYEFYVDTTVATEYDITMTGGVPAPGFPAPVTLPDVFIFPPSSGGGGGGVTTVTGVFPIASTGTTTPAISLQNESMANVTAAYGTDTAYFTASGGDAGLGNIIVGDAQGGIRDSKVFLPLALLGGIVGGHWTSSTAIHCTNSDVGLFGFSYNCDVGSQGRRAISPITAMVSKLSVVTLSASPETSTFGIFQNSNSSSSPGENFRLVIPAGSSAGVYTDSPSVPPFQISQGAYAWMNLQTYNAGPVSADLAGWSAEIVNSTSQPLIWGPIGATMIGSSANYGGPNAGSYYATAEASVGVVIPYASTFSGFCVLTAGPQAGDGSLVASVRLTHGGVTITTPLTVTYAINDPVSAYCDASDTQAVAAGDWFDFLFQDNSSQATAVASTGVGLIPSGATTATGMFAWMIYSPGAAAWTAPYTNYLPAFGTAEYIFANSADLPTETHARTPMPRSGTMRHLYCLYTSPPAGGTASAAVVKNGFTSALTVTIPTGGAGTQIVSDLIDSVPFAAGDTFDLRVAQSAGTTPAISSCSAEFD